jgi:hypothetical protein
VEKASSCIVLAGTCSFLFGVLKVTIDTVSTDHTLHSVIPRKMPKADGMILSKEEESDAEVRREDQDRINEFGRLNARLHEVRDGVYKLKVSERIWMPMSSQLNFTFVILATIN